MLPAAGFGALLTTSWACRRRRKASHHRCTEKVTAASELAAAKTATYTPPLWVPKELVVPEKKLSLAHLPTPIHRWNLPCVNPAEFEVWIKRDDCTGSELSGNKVRKLEFLLAEALAQGFSGGLASLLTVYN